MMRCAREERVRVMYEVVTGYVDGTISYCPYCGASLWSANFIGETKCEDCGRSFFVLEGEGE